MCHRDTLAPYIQHMRSIHKWLDRQFCQHTRKTSRFVRLFAVLDYLVTWKIADVLETLLLKEHCKFKHQQANLRNIYSSASPAPYLQRKLPKLKVHVQAHTYKKTHIFQELPEDIKVVTTIYVSQMTDLLQLILSMASTSKTRMLCKVTRRSISALQHCNKIMTDSS